MSENADANSGDGATDADSEDYSHLFRSEGFVSDVDLRVDVADNEDVEIDTDEVVVDAPITFTRGARTRHVDSYRRITGGEELVVAGQRIDETVHGSVHQKARFSAEAIIGGAYVNTIAGPYLRLAAWVDYLAWGGWAEIDAVRAELSVLMIRSHVGYAHAAVMRITLASRLIDDFQTRTENFGILSDTTTTHTDSGSPGGGITNEA